MMKHSHCSFCGQKFVEKSPENWNVKPCSSCKQETWNNPIPVVLMLIPVEDGVAIIRRGDDPGKGGLAFPGGHLECWETWQQGSCREIMEEINLHVPVEEVEIFKVSTANGNILALFSTCSPKKVEDLASFVPNHEVIEILIIREPIDLVFPSHTEALKEFFEKKKNHL